MDEVHSQFCNLVLTISLHIRLLIPAIELKTILPEIRKTSKMYLFLEEACGRVDER